MTGAASTRKKLRFDDHPLDGVEDILGRQEWHYARLNRNEIFMDLRGQYGSYHILFLWEDDMAALQIGVEYHLRIADAAYQEACCLINEMNGRVWMGRFVLAGETMIPTYRAVHLLRHIQSGREMMNILEDLLTLTIDECDAHYPAFMVLASEKTHDEEQLALALMPVAGVS